MAGRPRKTSIMKDITDDISKEEDKTFITKSGVVKTVSWLNVRSAPSFSASVIGSLNNGENVTIYAVKDGFGKISILEEKWVSLEFIV